MRRIKLEMVTWIDKEGRKHVVFVGSNMKNQGR